MKQSDHKTLLNWFKTKRIEDQNYQNIKQGWRKRHEIPQGQTEYGFFPPRSMDKTVRDLVREGYLESRPAGKLKEWRYLPTSEQEPEKHTSDEMVFFSINGFFPPKEEK